MAALSRQINAFFAVWLPFVCRKGFPNTYTVFAGGDDFFLIGPWRSTIELACRMRNEFARYVAGNPTIHFSAGLSMTKPGLPIRQLGALAEDALDGAKSHNPGEKLPAPKDAVTCYGIPVTWKEFAQLMDHKAALDRLATDLKLSSGYLYALLSFIDMAGKVNKHPQNALWHSRFAYRTRRMLETRIKSGKDPKAAEQARQRIQAELASEIAHEGIERFGLAYKIALFTHLYQQRD
jgi:CRISPR-associated protein Csm1